MDYYLKYLKYKTKYIRLKLNNQLIGGAGLDLILPSDIYNDTAKFMIKVKDYDDNFRILFGNDYKNIYQHFGTDYTQKFIQDSSILFNHPSNKKYIICIADNCIYEIPELNEAIYNNQFKTLNELLFGGNFISTPPNSNIVNNLGLIITTKTQDTTKNLELDVLLEFLKNNITNNQQIISINCSFQHSSGTIHIDELLCPMPYILYDIYPNYKMNYKIWIYKINNIDISDDDIRMINDYNIKNSEYNKRLDKRKNFEDNDPRKIDKKTGQISQIGQQLAKHSDDELKEIARDFLKFNKILSDFSFGSQKRKKFKEETMINNYKLSDLLSYSIFFNYILDPDFNKDIIKSDDHNIQEVKLPELKQKLLQEFNNELENNKKIISKTIFGQEICDLYEGEINRNFFVEYPIDLIFFNVNNGYYGFNMKEPPIFNRVFIKSEDKNYCMIPINNDKPSQVLNDFMIRESKFMIPINFNYVNTKKYHTDGIIGAGGNIHCLSKQIFK
jgi:hypothetical protein